MKLLKIILENNKIVHKEELGLSEKDISNLSNIISHKLVEYLDIDKQEVLEQVVESAIKELLAK
jgi:hypothetical protein